MSRIQTSTALGCLSTWRRTSHGQSSLLHAFIYLPSLVLCTLPSQHGWKHGFGDSRAKPKTLLLVSLIFLLVPFPIIVFVQQVTSLFVVTPQMELWSAIFLFGEGSLEASPQLMLQIFIILSDSERKVAVIQVVSIVSSIITISKTAIEAFLSESYEFTIQFIQNVLEHEKSNDDSFMIQC